METSELFDSELTDKWIHDEAVFILFHHVDLATQQVKPTTIHNLFDLYSSKLRKTDGMT